MEVGTEANVFTECTGFSLEKRLVILSKKIRWARMFTKRLGSRLSDICWVWIPMGIFVGLSSRGACAGTVPWDKPEPFLLIWCSVISATERAQSNDMPVIAACSMMCCLFSNPGLYWHRNPEDVNLEQYPRRRRCGPSKRRLTSTWHSVRAQKTWILNVTPVERQDVALEVVQLTLWRLTTAIVVVPHR